MGGQFGLHPPFSSELSTLLTDPRGYIPHATGPAEAAEKLQEDQDRPDLRVPSEGAVRAAGAEAEAGRGLVAADGTAGPLGRLYDLPEPRVHHRGGDNLFCGQHPASEVVDSIGEGGQAVRGRLVGSKYCPLAPQPLLTFLYRPQGRNPYSQHSWSLTVVVSCLMSPVLKI